MKRILTAYQGIHSGFPRILIIIENFQSFQTFQEILKEFKDSKVYQSILQELIEGFYIISTILRGFKRFIYLMGLERIF